VPVVYIAVPRCSYSPIGIIPDFDVLHMSAGACAKIVYKLRAVMLKNGFRVLLWLPEREG
jgi:hypothetical protein